MTADDVRRSRFLSLVLRHQPQTIGLRLDEAGWADVDELLRLLARAGRPLERAQLERLVAGNDKRRFAFSDDGRRIRASQGHSVAVDLGLTALAPPETLFHGTADRFLDSIRRDGLRPGSRRHVHLSADRTTAVTVGSRHGRPVVLTIAASAMAAAGHEFFRSANGVWLTAAVPPPFLATTDSSP